MAVPSSRDRSFRRLRFVLTVVVATAASALSAQFVLGVEPCRLCLLERWPYYLAAPIAAAVVASSRASRVRPAFVLIAALFVASLCLGLYHGGMEMHWWGGESSCSSHSLTVTSLEDLRAQLARAKVVPCDKPGLLLLGLSLAWWNAVVSLFLVGFCARAFAAGGRGGASAADESGA
jgi:disulfide bond formation protein DsbB